MEEYHNPYIEKIMNDMDNAYCIDCGIKFNKKRKPKSKMVFNK